MAATLTESKAKQAEERRPRPASSGGGGGGRPPDGGGEGGRRGGPDPRSLAVQRYKLGMWVALGGIVMIFAAFTSAMVVRKGLGGDWKSFDLPLVLWLSTAVLLASSFTIEKARRAMWRAGGGELQRWISVTAVLGAAFLACQLLGWKELTARGIYLASNPSNSFFYLLTAAHGVHLLGGILALSYVVFRVWRPTLWLTREAAVEATSLYWHFMDGLWVYLWLLLLVWR